MTPTERIEAISARMRARPARPKRTPEQKRLATWRGKVTCARKRRERIEAEREDWHRLVVECEGRISRVAERMGAAIPDARRILWDLGMWPLVVRLRQARAERKAAA